MPLKSIASGLVKPITSIIEKAVKDKDLRAQINADILKEIISVEVGYIQEASSIIRAEANSQSWLARNWRPLVMMFFCVMLGSYWFGYAPEYLRARPELMTELLGLIKIGMGGYVVGRSGEKIAKTLSENGGVKKVLGN